ncbi:MAG TPA: PIN domain-containing protein [Dehalococcoidia bacterium]|nr:PIN domain-containing protein [Dehalococcoidia bacterium]
MAERALVFLDASVLVAASRSPTGGSALAMDVCRGRRFRAALTAMVLLEARVNIAGKFGDAQLVRFYKQLAGLDPEMVPLPPAGRLEQCLPLTGEKDAHALAAELACGASYLLSLDRRHLITPAVQSAALPLRMVTPGEFPSEMATASNVR